MTQSCPTASNRCSAQSRRCRSPVVVTGSLPIDTNPLSPAVVVPLRNTSHPLSPPDHEPPDASVTSPLFVCVVPLPRVTDPLTADAPTDDQLPIVIDPLSPDAVVPPLCTIEPVSSSFTAFADRIVTRPDDDTLPAPLTTLMEPPLDRVWVVRPAAMCTSRPAPEMVAPTVKT